MLYDGFGREINPSKRPDERVLAVASLRDRWSGYPSKGLSPEKLGAIFREADAGDVYRQMELFEEMEEKDGHLFSILQTRKLAVTGLEFEIEPYSQEKKDLEIAEFVSSVISGLPDFEDNLLDMLDAIGKGFSALEIYWDIRDGKNVARHMEWVHPKKFTWANSLTPRLLTEDAQARGIDLPPFKFVFHLHKARSGYPVRQGVLRTCAWMYLFKSYDIKDWVAFAEVYGMPLRLGKYDSAATKEDKDALIQAVRSLGSDAAGVISKSTEIEFVEAVKNSGQAIYEVLAAFCDAQMSKAILGHSAGADSTPGKLGNEDQADDVREDLKAADCEMVSKSLRRDLIRPLVGFNFGWDAPLPWFKFKYEPEEDLKAEAEKIDTLTRAGVKTIPVKWVHERFGIPMPKDGEETISPVAQAPSFQMKAKHSCPACLVNKAEAKAGEADALDALTERLLNEADFSSLMQPVEKLLAEAGSIEEFRDRLLDAFEGMDPVKIGNLLQRAFAAAELLGMHEAE